MHHPSLKVQFPVLHWDKLSSNDHVGDASFKVSELLAGAPQVDPVTGLYGEDADGKDPMKVSQLPLSTGKEQASEAKHNLVITFRCPLLPTSRTYILMRNHRAYDALRQQFWCQCLKQYGTDDKTTLRHIELTWTVSISF